MICYFHLLLNKNKSTILLKTEKGCALNINEYLPWIITIKLKNDTYKLLNGNPLSKLLKKANNIIKNKF